MDEILRQVIDVYVEEVRDQSHRIAQSLLSMEADKGRIPGEIEELFRQAHSLKGSSASLGIDELAELAHCLESALTGVRRRQEPLTPTLVDAGLRATEAAQLRITGLLAETDVGLAEVKGATAVLQELVGSAPPNQSAQSAQASTISTAETTGELLPDLSATSHGEPTDITDAIRVSLDRLSAFERRSDDLRGLRGRIERQSIELGHVARGLEKLTRELQIDPDLANALLPTLRDELYPLLRSLRSARRDLLEDVESLQIITSDFEDNLRALRLVPAALLVQPIQLAVREASRIIGRDVQLSITGDQVHFDRLLLEELKNPLLHLVRNAVDHGIESTDVREAIGKPSRGRITVAIEQRGGQIEIAVSDDGRGIDAAAVRRKASERGLLSEKEAEQLSESEVYKLLLLPGFSTADTVTRISGRGVGLDVVKTSVNRLHGELHIQSTPGQGTQFTLSVPMTVLASRMLLIMDRDWTFALPQASVARVVLVRRNRLLPLAGHTVCELDGQTVMVSRLTKLLGIGDTFDESPSLPLILLRTSGTPVGVLCERILGEHDLVLRALPEELQSQPMLNAATLLPNGTALFVLSAAALVDAALSARAQPPQPAQEPGVILVADDSITTRSLLRSVLEVGGYKVRTAADGDEALRLLRSETVNLLVSDVRMPRLDGFSLIGRLRADPRTAHIPVVLFSSSDSEEERRRGMASGANAFLSKGAFDRGHLVDVVKNLLRGVA